MKRFYSLFCLAFILLNGALLTAQNYQTFNSARISYFEDINHYVRAVRIDSVHFGPDSVLFPMGKVQNVTDECYTPFGASWLGSKITVKANGDNLFFNRLNDTILIKTSAFLNETWIAYQIPGNIIVTAQITNVDTLSFLGVNDSVKFISFQVYDGSMTPLNHELNTFQIVISKDFGVVKTLNFYNFPDLITPYYYYQESLTEFQICGLSNPSLGLQNITWFDVYDFQIGDELHIRKYREEPDFLANTTYIYENLYIYKYLERTNYPDSIVYKLDVLQSYLYYTSTGSGYEYSHDTIYQKIVLNSDFDLLPEEVINDSYQISYLKMFNGLFKIKSDSRIYEYYERYDDFGDCYTMPLVDGCFSPYDYYKNLGGPYYNCSYMPYAEDSRTLVYYNSGGEIWGTPLVISKSNQMNSELAVQVYPNPAENVISVDIAVAERNCYVEIYNLIGVKLLSQEVYAGNNSVDINSLPCGVYFYQIKSSNEVLENGKFVKE